MLDSQCADHWRKHALSDKENACFEDDCSHDHELICQKCRSLEKVKALWYSGELLIGVANCAVTHTLTCSFVEGTI